MHLVEHMVVINKHEEHNKVCFRHHSASTRDSLTVLLNPLGCAESAFPGGGLAKLFIH